MEIDLMTANRLGLISIDQKRDKYAQIMTLLEKNPRQSLTEISRQTKIPVSTIYDILKEIKDKKLKLRGVWEIQ